MWKQFIEPYCSFSKKTRTGIYVLLSIIFLLLLIPRFFPLLVKPVPLQITELKAAAGGLKANDRNGTPYNPEYGSSSTGSSIPSTAALFYFDPNTLEEAGWVKLGLKPKTAATIVRYTGKGGRFREAEDLRKIWGLSPADAERLIPYVRIPEAKEADTKTAYAKPTTAPAKPIIEVNNADSAAFESLPGIGGKLAQRIIRFREKLGGFISVNQVAETFGLPDSTFQLIRPQLALNNTIIRQININTAGVEELKNHPYLRYAIANAIVQYRSQHGPFKQVSDLQQITLITPEIYAKALPYLKTE